MYWGRVVAVFAGAERQFTFGKSIAWWGGQGIAPSFVRWFHDSGAFELGDHGPPLLFGMASGVMSVATVVAIAGILAVSGARLRRRLPTDDGAIALCFTAISLVAQPGWHHYFSFLPFGAAVVLGSGRSSAPARYLALLSSAIASVPIVLLGDIPEAGYRFSQWGGTTIAALTLWLSLLLKPAREVSTSAGPG
jgi:hypothetical protein